MRYVLIFLMPFWLSAQTVKGRVVAADTNRPLESATVFIAQSTYKTLTDAEGNFELSVPPGSWQLVVTYVGYESVAASSSQMSDSSVRHIINLSQQEEQIREVKVLTAKQREYYLNHFRKQILGSSRNADDSKILNMDAVILDVSPDGTMFEASSDEPLVIEIPALNYRIEMLLSVFTMDWPANVVKFVGYASYSDLEPASKINAKRIGRNRMKAYLGSSHHFFRAIYSNTFRDEGFIVRSYTRRENPEYADTQTRKKLLEEYKATLRYSPRLAAPKYIFEFSKDELRADDFVLTDHSGKHLVISEGLQVTYIKDKEEDRFASQAHQLSGAFQKSEITAMKPKVSFHADGSYSDVDGIIFHGYMGWKKLSDTVPNDFEPYIME